MKITRKKLKQLIEAFISGPFGTKHIPDTDYPYSRLEKQLGGDHNKVSKALTLATGDKMSQEQFRNIESSFPIYDDEGNQIETDYIGDTQKMLDQYDQDSPPLQIKKIAEQVIPNPVFLDYQPDIRNQALSMTIIINEDEYYAAEKFVQEIKQKGLGKYLTYGRTYEDVDAAHKGTYIVKKDHPYKMGDQYEIRFTSGNPNWWKGFDAFPS